MTYREPGAPVPPFGINDAILALIGLTIAFAIAFLLSGCGAAIDGDGSFPYLCGESVCNPDDSCLWVVPDGDRAAPGHVEPHDPGAVLACCDFESSDPDVEIEGQSCKARL